jgi:glutamate racemase
MVDHISERDTGAHPIPARDAERSTHVLDDTDTTTKKPQALAPIGVFDSGAGGLTILSALRQVLPQENYIYFGDTANIPYGARSEAEIIELSKRACSFLQQQGVKLIVVACNTASQAALSTLRTHFSLPIVGVVPAVKPAARLTKRGRVGVAATRQASQAAYLRKLIDDFADGIEVFAIGCPELVTLVEAGEFDGPTVEQTLHNALQPLLQKDIDVLVLGCTHFPALRPTIERIVGPGVQVIDSGSAIARRVEAVLEAENSRRPEQEDHHGTLTVWCSGDAPHFSQIASSLLGYTVQARQIILK